MRRGTAQGGRGPSFFLSPLGIVFTTVVIDLVGFGIVLPILPLWAESFGASPTEIGLLTASYAVAQLLFAPLWGRLSDRYGRRPVILASLAGSAVAALLIGLATDAGCCSGSRGSCRASPAPPTRPPRRTSPTSPRPATARAGWG